MAIIFENIDLETVREKLLDPSFEVCLSLPFC